MGDFKVPAQGDLPSIEKELEENSKQMIVLPYKSRNREITGFPLNHICLRTGTALVWSQEFLLHTSPGKLQYA